MFRKPTTFAAVLALSTAPAFAGSTAEPVIEPVIAPAAPVAPASPNWTGFYAGGQLGYANVDTNVAGVDGDDLIGGLIMGYDYDMGDWVIGGGIDYDWADISLSPAATNVERVWRAKVRAGAKIGNGLLYGTGGYANADTNNIGDADGYFIGAGYEHMVAENFSVGGEVLYHEFDDFGATTTDADATTVQVRAAYRF